MSLHHRMCEDIEDHKFFSMNEFKYSCRTCGLAWKTMCHDNDMRSHMHVYNHLRIGCIFCDYVVNKGEDMFQSRRVDFEFVMRGLKVHVDAHIVKNSGRLTTYRCKNCDILVDVKDGGLSFRRDLYCEKIVRTGGRKKRDHYWDSTEDDEEEDYEEEDDSFEESTSTISTVSESSDTESTPCITLSEDESKGDDDIGDEVMMMSILPEPNLMFLSVLDFLELPDSALSGPGGMVALPVEDQEPLRDRLDSCQDRSTIPVISLEADDNNTRYEGKDSDSSDTIILSDHENDSCRLESCEKIFDKLDLAYEVRLAKFLRSGMEENGGNPDSKEMDKLLETEPISTSFDRKKYMFVSADCWDVPEDGVSNIQEDFTLSKVNASNVGGTCVSLTESTGSFGSWRSPSSSLFSSPSPRALFSPDPKSDTSEGDVESHEKLGLDSYLGVESTKPWSDPGMLPITEPDAESSSDSSVKIPNDPGTLSITEPHAKSGSDSSVKMSSDPRTLSITEPDAESGSDSSVKTPSDSETLPITEPHAESGSDSSVKTQSVHSEIESPASIEPAVKISSGLSYQKFFNGACFRKGMVALPRIQICRVRAISPIQYRDPVGEINSDDDESNDSSDDTFDHLYKVSCGNVDGCSGMDGADGEDSEHLSASDDSGSVESSTNVTDKSSEREKDYTSVTRTYRDPVNVTLSDIDVEMDGSSSDTDDAGSAVIEVSDTSTSAESSNEGVVEVVMIE